MDRGSARGQQHTDRQLLDDVVNQALFGSATERAAARRSIRTQAADAGVWPASIWSLYRARAAGVIDGFTVPAMNVRGLSYDLIRAVIRASQHHQVGAFIIEIARSEISYTGQRPDDVVVAGLAAALRERYRGPLFFQGDHYQVNVAAGIDEEIRRIESLIDESFLAGFYNLDIDASTTVDLTMADPAEQQARNVELTVHLTKYIRRYQPVKCTIGGEIGKIGGRVSRRDDLRAFMTGYRRTVALEEGISKVAVQTGTRHGGVPDRSGRPTAMTVDFTALADLSRVARSEFGLAGVVQHGASTLPLELFGRFSDAGTAEIHLSTEFQNIIFDHPAFPAELRSAIDSYCFEQFGQERVVGQTDAQFLYTQRKRAWGPFRQQLAKLPGPIKQALGQALEAWVTSLFERLRVLDTRAVVDRYVTR
ncbi:MAG: class II fructose-bisphosphate aldolase [Candidatus Kerfeldbacteria bacterium]|nr:class II fructose-bisphosphate aldolase [Candidatus Kerfeldbacteria bacterium]